MFAYKSFEFVWSDLYNSFHLS